MPPRVPVIGLNRLFLVRSGPTSLVWRLHLNHHQEFLTPARSWEAHRATFERWPAARAQGRPRRVQMPNHTNPLPINSNRHARQHLLFWRRGGARPLRPKLARFAAEATMDSLRCTMATCNGRRVVWEVACSEPSAPSSNNSADHAASGHAAGNGRVPTARRPSTSLSQFLACTERRTLTINTGHRDGATIRLLPADPNAQDWTQRYTASGSSMVECTKLLPRLRQSTGCKLRATTTTAAVTTTNELVISA